MRNRNLFSRSRIEALVIMAGAVAYIWGAFGVPTFYRMPGVPGPSVFPLILGIIMGLAGLCLLLSPGAEDSAAQSTKEHGRIGRADRGHFYLMWALLLAYVFVLPDLGFLMSSCLLLAVFFFLLGERRWYLAIPIALVFTVAIYFVFAKGLQIRLPAGILEDFLR